MADTNTQGQANTEPNGGTNTQQEGGNDNSAKTYSQQELDNIVTEQTGRATKSALSSFFKQKGLSQEEAENAMNDYLETKKKNTPDVSAMQNEIASANKARLIAELNQHATLEAIKQGADVKSIPYVLKMADMSAVADKDGAINAEKLTEAIKKVLDDIPALKILTGENANGIRKIGGDGTTSNSGTKPDTKAVPTKKWNRFNN